MKIVNIIMSIGWYWFVISGLILFIALKYKQVYDAIKKTPSEEDLEYLSLSKKCQNIYEGSEKQNNTTELKSICTCEGGFYDPRDPNRKLTKINEQCPIHGKKQSCVP